MTDKLGLVRDYLFGEPKDREMARLALADWFEEQGLPEAPALRSLGVSLWVWPGDWDQQECVLHESVTAEDAVARCHRSFASRAELDAYSAGFHQSDRSTGSCLFYTAEECLARVRPLWVDFHQGGYDDGYVVDYGADDDEDPADPNGLGDLEDWSVQSGDDDAKDPVTGELEDT